MGAIQFWLSQGNTRFQLPVNPESLRINSPFGYEDVSVTGLGEYSVPHERGLKEFSLGSFFPAEYNPVYCETTQLLRPSDYVNHLEKWRDSRKPFRLTVTGTNINILVTLRAFSYDVERAGHIGDVFFEMSLKEHREIKVRTTKLVKNKAPVKRSPSRPAASKPPAPKTYTVRSGDSLWKISAKYYGSGVKWRTIYNANKKVIGKNPHLIYQGQKLVIP
ncbi:LysM peptidoglycan-binding domain-containing protein [Cytobacillus oceanisediminis]|uniref:LysM domain-containing protein n=1 Tax=Cytobacillus oceanisediminis 2691 TaxID=1196031 RepID=A0A160MA70_9BACI|nr:LysM peptidoglycan-binding domain-containing protein [Cytobacillus oceanisediminis]AND39622.1 hypothetical protein A361_10895 [Cytobacillus oceanisediminis 2691]